MFSRLDVSSRSIFAIVEPGSCFAGTLAELMFAADRSYMLDVENGPQIALSEMNFGTLSDGKRLFQDSSALLRGRSSAPEEGDH